jgi:hypothetical protein
MLEFLSKQLKEPSESFVRFVASETAAANKITAKVVERLTPILRKAIQSAIVEHVARSFEPANAESTPPPPSPLAKSPVLPVADEPSARDVIVTTPEELEISNTIMSWIREVVPNARLALRDSKSYAAIYQENVRKWFVRFVADRRPFWVALRGIPVDEARKLAPGVDVGADPGNPGGSRFVLPGVADIVKLRSAAILAYQREAERKVEQLEAVE